MPRRRKAKVAPSGPKASSAAELRDQLTRQEYELQSLRKKLREEREHVRQQEELAKQNGSKVDLDPRGKLLALGAGWMSQAGIGFETHTKSISFGPRIFDTYRWQVGKDWLTSILTCAEYYKSGTGEFVYFKIPKQHSDCVDISLRKLLLHCVITMPVSNGRRGRVDDQSIEERNFQGGLIVIEMHFTQKPPIGRKAAGKAMETIKRTMDKTLKQSEVREVLAKNVDIWLRLQMVFQAAIPTLSKRSLREAYAENTQPGVHIPESNTLIAEHHATLLEDLTVLNSLLVIARNMLAIKEVAQDICATAQLDRQVTKLIVICVNVTSKGYDGESLDHLTRRNVNEITELYKKLLVTGLQFLHNLTMGNDRLKMAFWFEMLFDNDLHNDTIHEQPPDGLRVEAVYEEVRNWLRRNSAKSPMAETLLAKHAADVELGNSAGHLPPDSLSADMITHMKGELVRKLTEEVESALKLDPTTPKQPFPIWTEQAPSKEEQDILYGRVSHEIDVWWKRVRDANYDNWVVPMETVQGAIARARACKDNAMTRCFPRAEQDLEFDRREQYGEDREGEGAEEQIEYDNRSLAADDGEDDGEEEEEEEEDDDSYVEGPLRGLLTEIPNILDTKQIEALHMTVKACIVDAMGSGLTKVGENLQKTRCKMFLALDCGKNLLREMLVFIAVWEQAETQFIFQITAQIIESFHHNALLPYAWNSLRIVKDIVSPAQTVLLRLINYMFRARKSTTIYSDPKDYNRDAKLVHFLYNYFRCRVVPDCIALIYAQSQIRTNQNHPQDFPVDLWDMERAKDGLSQCLDFISVIADIPEMRPLLIEWDATYELITLLNALEAGVARKPLVEPARKNDSVSPRPTASAGTDATISDEGNRPASSNANHNTQISPATTGGASPPSLPPLHDTPHKFPWSGIKVQILIILTTLVAPPNGRSSPGNPLVQKQILEHGGILALLNCCVYDGHNEYLKERATLCIKWVMDGCDEAQQFVRELSPLKDQRAAAPGQRQVAGQSQGQAQLQAQVEKEAGAGIGAAGTVSGEDA